MRFVFSSLPPVRCLILVSCLVASLSHVSHAQYLPDDQIESVAPDSFLVMFETSKGHFVVKAHRSWSPLAVDRLYHLIRLEYFDESSIYRMVPGFVAQFGIHNDEKVNKAWKDLGIEDEPVRMSNRRGTVSFARGGPQTRGTQLFINLRDNATLDSMPVGGVVGYPPIGVVVSGMEDVIDLFHGQYGNAPAMHQDSINALGRTYLDKKFPGLDYIKQARIAKEY